MTRTPLLLVPLLPLLLTTHADAVRARTSHMAYRTGGGSGVLLAGDWTIQNERFGAVSFGTLRRDRSFEIAIADDAGLPVLAQIAQDTNGDGQADDTTNICSATKAPVPIKAKGAYITVYVLAGQCGNSVSMRTTGTVTARFLP